jgi:glyoxylase I family protein
MERVTGIGGIFFRSADPAALSAWYAEHLGVVPTPETEGEPVWLQEAGPTVFGPTAPDSGMFPPAAQLVINFRVADLEAMAAQLAAAAIPVEVDPEQYSIGRFATLEDPEGNPIQLWQPSPE